MDSNRLSSDYLYSYTQNFDALKNILRAGFRYSRNIETLPYSNYVQENYIVCFCDILPEHSGYHKEVYGKNALSFDKEWGIKNGVSPLRYVHGNSPGCNAKYTQIKNDIRTAFTGQDKIGDFLTLINFIEARRKSILTKDRIEEEIDNDDLQSFLDGINQRFQEKKEKFGSKCITEIFNDWIAPLLTQLNNVINELELRDSYMRIYQGDFRDIKGKILYDEREWRAVKYIQEADIDKNSDFQNICASQGYLPEEYNLKFDDGDLFEILVESSQRKSELITFIEKDIPRFCSIIPSIKVISD